MKLYKNLPEITVYNGTKPIRAVVIEDAKHWVRVAKIGSTGNLSKKSWLVMKFDYKLRGRADQNSWTAPMIYNNDKTIGVDEQSLNKLDNILSPRMQTQLSKTLHNKVVAKMSIHNNSEVK
tara:strand:+ start:179 stop:541 length:363 start_codon:yes stop_codon:yes gene_type:complete